jgi:hypothetical protein
MSGKPEQDPIEQYLDAVCEHFKVLPPDEVARNRQELSNHLEAAVADRVAEGVSRSDAVADVLTRFGPAGDVGRKIGKASVQAWLWELDRQDTKAIRRLPTLRAVGSAAGLVACGFCGLALGFGRYIPACMVASFCLGVLKGALDAINTHSIFKNGTDYDKLTDAMILRTPARNVSTRQPWHWRLAGRFMQSAVTAGRNLRKNPMRGIYGWWWIRMAIWLTVLWLLPIDDQFKLFPLLFTLYWSAVHFAYCVTLTALQRRSRKA